MTAEQDKIVTGLQDAFEFEAGQEAERAAVVGYLSILATEAGDTRLLDFEDAEFRRAQHYAYRLAALAIKRGDHLTTEQRG